MFHGCWGRVVGGWAGGSSQEREHLLHSSDTLKRGRRERGNDDIINKHMCRKLEIQFVGRQKLRLTSGTGGRPAKPLSTARMVVNDTASIMGISIPTFVAMPMTPFLSTTGPPDTPFMLRQLRRISSYGIPSSSPMFRLPGSSLNASRRSSGGSLQFDE